MSTLKDKIVVVTGSTRGFGYAIAESMLKAGAVVVITGRSQEALERALSGLQAKGRVSGFLLDVREEEQAYRLVRDVVSRFGRIDVWVNNAGFSNAAGLMLDMNPQDALEMFLANNLGMLHCTQAVMEHFTERGEGMLVNIYGNGSFLRPASPTGLYGASKAWVASFTRSLAVELKGSGIRLLGFSPGMMLTDMLSQPTVVGERGRDMLKNFGFVLRFLAGSPGKAADGLVQAVESQRKEFSEVRLLKPWTPLLGLLRVAWENLTHTGAAPQFDLHYQPAYLSKYSNKRNS